MFVDVNMFKRTHVKTHKLLQVCKQVATNLFTSCRQLVLVLLVVVTSLELLNMRRVAQPIRLQNSLYHRWLIMYILCLACAVCKSA